MSSSASSIRTNGLSSDRRPLGTYVIRAGAGASLGGYRISRRSVTAGALGSSCLQGKTVEEPMGPSSSRDARVRAAWQADRGYLFAIAAGMLGRPAEAEDVVQEAFARLAGASIDDIGDIRGWLVVVTRRLCLDRLGSAEARRTTATAELPEAGQDGVDPADPR
jgi:hypothetical protein